MRRLLNSLPWRRRRLETDLARELQHHVERRVEDLVHAGVADDEARRQAVLELGGLAQVEEAVRDTWISRSIDNLIRDVRYAARTLSRAPGFVAAAVLSLALGIGANAAIFSLVDQVLLRTLPVNAPDRLVLLSWKGNSISSQYGFGNVLSLPMCRDLQTQKRLFEGVFCRYSATVNVSTGQQPEPIRAEIVSGSYFDVLGIQPELGRLINNSDDREPGEHPVIVLSNNFWQRAFGGAPNIVGRTVLINNYPMTVVGVAPAAFRGVDLGAVPALWIPAMMTGQVQPEIGPVMLERRSFWMQTFGRLAPGITLSQATAGLQPWFKSTLESESQAERFPTINANQRRSFFASTMEVEPAARGWSQLRTTLDQPLRVLMGGTLLLLVLASLNFAGLLIARGAARGRELTTRLALGASRSRITVQLLSESMLITLAGGVIGVAIAPLVSRGLLFYVSPTADLSARIDLRIVLLSLAVSVLTGALCGLAPAIQASRTSLAASLKEKSPIGGTARVRRILVIAQMSFALVLLVGAGLFVQTLARLYAKGPGFATTNLVMFRLDPLSLGYTSARAEQLMRDVSRSLRALPGVKNVAVANSTLLTGGSSTTHLTIQADTRITTERPVQFMRPGAGFFSTLGAKVVAGRDFDDGDVRPPGAEPRPSRVIMVNERFARRYFGSRNPVGARVGLGNRPNSKVDIEIVGVVSDFTRRSLRDDAEVVFFPFWDRDSGDGVFYLRMRGTSESTFAAIRSAVARVDETLPVVSLRTVDDQIDQSLSSERMMAVLSTAFGVIALLLAVVGLYGVMSFVVTRRRQEIGVRLALGATPSTALWLIVRDALSMTVAGAVIALPGAWLLTRLVEARLFGVHAMHAPTIAMASGLLMVVGLGAAMIPAWRAASVSPIEALRDS